MPADDSSDSSPAKLGKRQGQEARRRVEAYHKQKLTGLMEQVRRAIDAFDTGKIDAFDLDYAMQTYCKQSEELYLFINTYYPSNSKLPLLLTLMDDEAQDRWRWEPQTVLSEEVRAKVLRNTS